MSTSKAIVGGIGRAYRSLLAVSPSQAVLRVAIAATLFAYQPANSYLQAATSCEVKRSVITLSNQSCQCAAGQCPPILKVDKHYVCDDVEKDEHGQDGGCVKDIGVVGEYVQCQSNANLVAITFWAGGFVFCMGLCAAAIPPVGGLASPFALMRCLNCIGAFSYAPTRACDYVYCTRGERGEQIFKEIFVSISGDDCTAKPADPAA